MNAPQFQPRVGSSPNDEAATQEAGVLLKRQSAPWKTGDRLLCISPGGQWLTIGRVYTVTDCSAVGRHPNWPEVFADDGHHHIYPPTRFRRAFEEEPGESIRLKPVLFGVGLGGLIAAILFRMLV